MGARVRKTAIDVAIEQTKERIALETQVLERLLEAKANEHTARLNRKDKRAKSKKPAVVPPVAPS